MKKYFILILMLSLCFVFTACENLSDFEKTFGSKYIGVQEGEKYYFVDENGQNPFGMTFTSITNFENGLARVLIDKKFHYINEQGEIISKDYQGVYRYPNGYFTAYDSETQLYTILNKNLEPALNKKFSNIINICDGYIATYHEKKYEIYTIKGKLILSQEYSLYLYNDGIYSLKKDNEYTVYNIKGDKIVSGKSIVAITDELIIIKVNDFTYKVYNKKGKELNDGYTINLYDESVGKFWASKGGKNYTLNMNFDIVAYGRPIQSDYYGNRKDITFVKNEDDQYVAFNSDAKEILDRPYDQLYLVGNCLVAFDCDNSNNYFVKERSYMYIFDMKGNKIFETNDLNYFNLPISDTITNDVYVLYQDSEFGYKYYLVNTKEKQLDDINIHGEASFMGGLALIKSKADSSGEYISKIVRVKDNTIIFDSKNITYFRTLNNKYIVYILEDGNRGIIDYSGGVIREAKYRYIYVDHVNN